MKIDEYAPILMPTSSANAKSFSVSPPKKSSEAIGSSVMNVVAIDRLIVSQSETLAIVANGRPAHQRHVLPDAVEDDDRVVDRVTEDGQHRGNRRPCSPPARSARTRRP